MTKYSKLSGSGKFVKGGSDIEVTDQEFLQSDDSCEDCREVGRCGACAMQDSLDEDDWEDREFIDFTVIVRQLR